MNKLTQKQENFTKYIFEGLSQREAYIKAGYSNNALPSTIDEAACRLLGNSKITARLKELNDKVESKILYTREQAIQRLKEIACEENPSKYGYHRSANIQAISEIAKISHWYDENTINFNNLTIAIVEEQPPESTYRRENEPDHTLIENRSEDV